MQLENLQLKAPPDDAYDFTITIATGENDYDDIVNWLRLHTKPL
jgi:prophage maintenance system killer protein